jgi:tripartite-type tricarboxylate transporter receptor subunit TctC
VRAEPEGIRVRVPSLQTVLLACLLLAPAAIQAQSWPSGQVTLVVPFQPGGPVDLIPRTLAPKLAEALGVPVIVENRPGAGGNVGSAHVAKAKPDGHVLLATAGSALAVNKWLYKGLNYDPEKDFAPVVRFADTPNVFVAPTEQPFKTLQELIQVARSRPGELNHGTPGSGTSPHLCVELFMNAAGKLRITHVPYKGGADVVRDLLANRIQLACSNMTPVIAHIQAGKLRALAVTSRSRHPLLPDVPTVDEAGLPGFEVTGWFALLAPAGTPAPVVERLNAEVVKALRDAAVAERMRTFGVTPIGDSSAEFGRYLAAEMGKWRKLIEETKLSAE